MSQNCANGQKKESTETPTTRSGPHEQPHPQTEVCSQRQLSTCARGGTVQKDFAALHARRFCHRRDQANFTRSRKFQCPLRLEEGETSQELGGLLRPSPSHCGAEDHQPRATPCPQGMSAPFFAGLLPRPAVPRSFMGLRVFIARRICDL